MRTPLAAALTAPKPAADDGDKPVLADADWGGDVLAEARATITLCMRGKAGRNAQVRLQSARLILTRDYLAELSDEALLAEVKRRREKAGRA